MTDDEAYARWQSNGVFFLNVILRCLKCGVLVEEESYTDYVGNPMPFLCEGCHRESAEDHPGQADSNGPLPH